MKKNITHSPAKKIEKPKIKGKTETSETPEEKSSQLDLAQHPVLKGIVCALIFVACIAVSTFTANQMTGINTMDTAWYRIAFVCVAIIFLVGWTKNEINIDAAKTLAKWLIPVAIVMLVINVSWNTVVEIEGKKPANEQGKWLNKDTKQPTVKGLTNIIKMSYDKKPSAAEDPDEKKLVLVPVFEKTYTYADAFDKEDGSIRTFDITKDVEIGDQVEIIGKLLKQDTFTGEELWIWRGKNKSPKWARTKNGYYSKKIKAINVGTGNNGKYFIVSFDGRKDVSVTVKVKGFRKITNKEV